MLGGVLRCLLTPFPSQQGPPHKWHASSSPPLRLLRGAVSSVLHRGPEQRVLLRALQTVEWL
jgi:hypothetical protein